MTDGLFNDDDDPAAILLLAAGWYRVWQSGWYQWTLNGVDLYGVQDALAEQKRREAGRGT